MDFEVQEMINLVREEMERMLSGNPEQEKSMETDIQIVRELIPDMSIKNVIKPAKPCLHIVVGPDFPRPFAQGKEEEPR